MRSRAFALLDLVLVLAVLSAAAAVIAPVLARSSAERNASICVRNLSQIGQAVGMYVQDYDGKLPTNKSNPGATYLLPQALTKGPTTTNPQITFVDGLDPYLRSVGGESRLLDIWRCPSITGYGITGTKKVPGYGDNRVSYALNYGLLEKTRSSIRDPELVLMFREIGLMVQANTCASVSGTSKPERIFLGDADDWFKTGPAYFARPHGDQTNVLFADGHVTTHPKSQLTTDLVVRDASGRWKLTMSETDQQARLWLTP